MFNNLIPSVILSVIQRVSVIQSAAKNLFPMQNIKRVDSSLRSE